MKTEIKDELKGIATLLADVGNANCYRVPENYFEAFAEEIISKIQLPFTQLPYTAPALGYFDGLADSILNKIKSNGTIVEAQDSEVATELMEISPLIAGLKKINVYTVPENYFTNFKVPIAAEEKGRVVSMQRSPVRWMRYAAAAVIAGIIAVSGLLLLNNSNAGDRLSAAEVNYSKRLATVSDKAIASYLNQSPAEMDITPATLDDNKINAGSFAEKLLNEVPDSAIQEYLQQNQVPLDEKDIKGI